MVLFLLGESPVFGLFACHSQMVGSGLATFALFGLAGRRGADKPIYRVVSGILRFDIFTGGIFFGRVFGVSLLELEL